MSKLRAVPPTHAPTAHAPNGLNSLDEILAEAVTIAKLDLEMTGDESRPNKLGGIMQDEDALMDRIITDQSALGSH